MDLFKDGELKNSELHNLKKINNFLDIKRKSAMVSVYTDILNIGICS